MKKQVINQKKSEYVCSQCRKYKPYMKNHLDLHGVPVLGSCPHSKGLVLRNQKACESFIEKRWLE